MRHKNCKVSYQTNVSMLSQDRKQQDDIVEQLRSDLARAHGRVKQLESALVSREQLGLPSASISWNLPSVSSDCNLPSTTIV